MELQFIDQNPNRIGRSDRRIIRSHIMRGKNTGKRRSTRRQTNVPLNAPECGYLIPQPVFWGDLCCTLFPQELDSVSKALKHRRYMLDRQGFFDMSDALFPPHFCNKFDIYKPIWVNSILGDEACKWWRRRSLHIACLYRINLPY
ncbi:hypothetical protein N7451_009511 [Penicillium sp. IBT 35674x]|nr:hypothetical protein N7451_009511 [Penicillium sp. IBT 35674x]